jgi:hypothetical protein
MRQVWTIVVAILVAASWGCSDRSAKGMEAGPDVLDAGVMDASTDADLYPADAIRQYFPRLMEKDVDILFVIDNSNSMAEKQANLSHSIPTFIEALRSPKLDNRIPHLHIGVVSTDLGAGGYSLPSCEVVGGDGGKLQVTPRKAGCIPPSRPWIAYIEDQTNIESTTADSVEQVKEAFQCIVELGTDGCTFEHQMEAARRALDPKLNLNPGFIRPDAFLAVAFFTDEDDCSAQKPQLFDLSLEDTLGTLTSFRCFEFGITCDINDRTEPGPRENCVPSGDWLYKVDEYVSFFRGIKPLDWVIMFAIAGPTDNVEVSLDGRNPTLKPSCQTSIGKAVPAIRIKSLVDAFGRQGHFNEGTDPSYTQKLDVNICSPDYSPALRLMGKVIVTTMLSRCVSSAPLTKNGGLACNKGDVLGTNTSGQKVICAASCLHQADCMVNEITHLGTSIEKAQVVEKCAPEKFANADDKDCGSICPCWRIVPRPECNPQIDGTPYSLDILGSAQPAKGAFTELVCRSASETWGTHEFAELRQCN